MDISWPEAGHPWSQMARVQIPALLFNICATFDMRATQIMPLPIFGIFQ